MLLLTALPQCICGVLGVRVVVTGSEDVKLFDEPVVRTYASSNYGRVRG